MFSPVFPKGFRMRTILLSGVLILCTSTDGFAQPRHRQIPTKPAPETIPTIQTQATKVLKSPTWDYMIWTDASEKKHLRAKLLTANEATVHLANLEGSRGQTFKIQYDFLSWSIGWAGPEAGPLNSTLDSVPAIVAAASFVVLSKAAGRFGPCNLSTNWA